LTPAGQAVLAEAAPLWEQTHAATEPLVGSDPLTLRAALRALMSFKGDPVGDTMNDTNGANAV